MKLGLVTYNLAKDWDVPTIIERCSVPVIDTGTDNPVLRFAAIVGACDVLVSGEQGEADSSFDKLLG